MSSAPWYLPLDDECALFESAHRRNLAVMLKGPTGCGKTRMVEAMAHRLGRPLITVSCHEDLTAADLVGRFILRGDDTIWVDGPLLRGVRQGAICYLDEVVEARQDTTVVLHSLTDHRRALYVDRIDEEVSAAAGFMLVVSYNPGYQSVLKDLKDSTRQRMVAIRLGHPPPDAELEIVVHEAGLDPAQAADLVRIGAAIRQIDSAGLREVASTRTLVAAGHLIMDGVAPLRAAVCAIAQPLTDDPHVMAALVELIESYLTPAIVERAS